MRIYSARLVGGPLDGLPVTVNGERETLAVPYTREMLRLCGALGGEPTREELDRVARLQARAGDNPDAVSVYQRDQVQGPERGRGVWRAVYVHRETLTPEEHRRRASGA